MNDLVGMIMDYEAGDLDLDQTLALFSELIKSGMAWRLQGSYGRQATALIDNGEIDAAGVILR